MAIDLAKKFAPYTDELFKAESKTSLVTNSDFEWTGAHSVNIWKISTVALGNYRRTVDEHTDDTLSRYGKIVDLDAQVEEMLLSRDLSFIFNVDRLDEDETSEQVEAGKCLARELREVVVPEVDSHVYAKMVAGAGTTVTGELNTNTVYDAILEGSKVLDDGEVPDTERVLIVTPTTYAMLKKASEFDHTDVGAEMKLKGVVGVLDGMMVVKVPAVRLPEGLNFMIAHPSATVAPVKLEDYGIHNNTVLSSGSIVTGRIAYDAFVLDNKRLGIYVHTTQGD